MSVTVAQDTAIERLDVSAYTIPTDRPEADGTLAWDSTTLMLVEAHAGGHAGLGWTYGPAAIAALVRDVLGDAVVGGDALDVPAAGGGAGPRLGRVHPLPRWPARRPPRRVGGAGPDAREDEGRQPARRRPPPRRSRARWWATRSS